MFESLSTRVQDVFKSLRGEVRLTPEQVEEALREIRLALLEADVNFKVVKAFVDRVRDRAMDQTVLRSLTPGQQVIKIVRDELLALFGDAEGGLTKSAPVPRVILLLGLQGSGKTTTAAKLGMWLARQGRHPLMVSTDVRRPAAIEQLSVLGDKADVRVFTPDTMDPVARAGGALAEARAKGFDTVLVDTAGRLHIDDDLMTELQAIKDAVQPADLLYVADAMTGQDAIKSAGEFNRRVGVTGVVLTKLDGDARGGAALSVVSVVGVPIAFIGSGERLEDLELFHPDRIVSRMLGMGDMLSLIEKAEQAIDKDEAEQLEEKLRKNEFTLDDFRTQLKTIRRMGPLESVLGMIPGLGGLKQLADNKPDENQMGRVEAIISSMTPAERRNHTIINGSRRKRIAAGSGTSVEEINRLLKQFTEMRRVLQMIGQGGMPGMGGGLKIPKMPQKALGAPSGKRRKKGGPWGLIKTR
ncbi:MAG: signal recognition particle protein [Acidobacteria bacterium RIFCSPLOWO2_12_FULL_67_14]|nr:MAG: signal recognition particle protein [Acidobacteria bacterium RIFCSPLOWO2_02_FULL_67_21]OFW35665.1 MAG: signal recognition particle protein [Acidobacteria bacterium RIFCSPLOWO2_12_FULL_67_14]